MLITGHRGYIGSKLYAKIGGKILDGDILDTKKFPKVDLVIHVAGQSEVNKSLADPLKDARNNILATIKLLTEYPKAKFIYISSAGAINNGITSPLGLSKLTAEKYVELLHDNYVICRLPNIYGTKKSVVDIFKNGDTCYINGSGDKKRNYVYINDIVDGIILSTKWEKGSYIFADKKSYSVLDLAEATGKVIVYREDNPFEVMEATFKNNTPNWKPTTNVLKYICE